MGYKNMAAWVPVPDPPSNDALHLIFHYDLVKAPKLFYDPRMSLPEKVAFIVNDTQFFLSHRISLAREASKIFETVVIVPKSELNHKIKSEGFRVVEYPLAKTGTNPFSDLWTIFKIFQILRKEKPNLVHSFTIKPALYGSLASRWAGVPNIIVTITGLGYVYVSNSKKSKVIKLFVDALYKWAMQTPKVHVIFQNPDDKSLFTDKEFVPDYRTTIIPGSGVAPDRFYPKPKSQASKTFKILAPCRMLWDKGVGDLVEAFLSLNLDHNFQLVLAGKTDPSNPSAIPNKQLREWESQGNIKWLGHVSDMNTLYSDCDIVCLPSYREGLPLSLLEASLCQKPIVTTDAPGCNFLVEHNVNGLIFPPRDVKKLADTLALLIRDDSLRTRLGKEAREIALNRYTADAINEQILKFYKLKQKREHNA